MGKVVLLVNDTYNEKHLGCKLTSLGNRTMLEADGHTVCPISIEDKKVACPRCSINDDEIEKFARHVVGFVSNQYPDAEAICINSEGSLHHGSHDGKRGRRADLVAWARAGEILKLPTILVNGVYDTLPDWYGPILQSCADVVAREPLSQKEMERIGVKCRVQFDSSMAVEPVPDKAGHEGRIIFTDTVDSKKNPFMEALCDDYDGRWMPLRDDWRSEYIKNPYAGAKLVVTGRFHGAVLALLAGVPFLAIPSNTHKIEGLAKMVDREEWVCDDLHHLSRTLGDWFGAVPPCLDKFKPLDTMRALK